jgi:hypothetical protein
LDNVAARQHFLLAENPRPPRHKGSQQLHGPGVSRCIIQPSSLESGNSAASNQSRQTIQAMHLTVQITPLPRPTTSGQASTAGPKPVISILLHTYRHHLSICRREIQLAWPEADRRLSRPTHTQPIDLRASTRSHLVGIRMSLFKDVVFIISATQYSSVCFSREMTRAAPCRHGDRRHHWQNRTRPRGPTALPCQTETTHPIVS